MTAMKMTDGEELILQSNSGILTLTSHRVRIAQRRRGETSLTSITLDAVESCGLSTRRRPALLYIAFFLGFVGVYNLMARTAPATPIDAAIFVIALLSAVWFAVARSDMLVIAARSGPVQIPIHGMKNEEVVDFIDTLEAAKLRFIGPPR